MQHTPYRLPTTWWLLAGVMLACAASPATPVTPAAAPAIAPADERSARFERALSPEERLRFHRIPALSIAVFENYELAWSKAYGWASREGQQPATAQTLFLAGSISKSVNALAVLEAAADGRLSLDAPINEQLESWKLPDNELTRATPVTLRQLLSHTAGTTVHGFPGYIPGARLPTLQQILDGVPPANTGAVRVDLAPGTRVRYSGGGIVITQLALVERSKRPYAELLRDSVLIPLGMTESSFEQDLPPERARYAAVAYDSQEAPVEGLHHIYPEMAAAGLWTTPTDLARFFLEIARARAQRASRVPSAIALQMTTKVVGGGEGGVGLGVFLFQDHGVPCFGHGGVDAGFMANAVVSLDGGYGFVVMTNSDNGSKIFDEIDRAVFAVQGWPSPERPIAREDAVGRSP